MLTVESMIRHRTLDRMFTFRLFNYIKLLHCAVSENENASRTGNSTNDSKTSPIEFIALLTVHRGGSGSGWLRRHMQGALELARELSLPYFILSINNKFIPSKYILSLFFIPLFAW